MLAIACAIFYLAFLRPGIYSVDGNSMLFVAESVVTHHNVTVPGGVPGRDGRLYSAWYPLQSILSLPLVAAAVLVSRISHAPFHLLSTAFVTILPPIFTAVTVRLVLLIAVQLGSTIKGARRAALCFALGTIALVYTRTFYAEPLLAMLITGAIYLVFSGSRRNIWFAAVLAALAVLAKPTGLFVGLALSLYLLLKKTPLRFSVLPELGSCLGMGFYAIYNEARFGSPLTFGQPWAFAISNVPVGFFGQLVSPGLGLLWYSPVVFLGVLGAWQARDSRRLEVLLIAGLATVFLLLHSVWGYWHEGWSWGPRFLVPVIPALMALTGVLEGKAVKALLLLAFLGFLVSAPTFVAYYDRYYEEEYGQQISERDQRWSPSQAPAVRMWGAAYRVIVEMRRHNPQQPVAIWWSVPGLYSIPLWLGATCTFGMMFLAWRITRSASSTDSVTAARNYNLAKTKKLIINAH